MLLRLYPWRFLVREYFASVDKKNVFVDIIFILEGNRFLQAIPEKTLAVKPSGFVVVIEYWVTSLRLWIKQVMLKQVHANICTQCIYYKLK